MDFEIAFLSLMGGLSLFLLYMERRSSTQEWKAAAELSRLQDVKVSRLVPRVTGRLGQVEVRIGGSTDKKRPTRIVVTVPGPPGLENVSIRRGLLALQEIEVGHPGFDREFVIGGPVQLASALLDEEMRRVVTRVSFECELRLSSGQLRADLVDERIFEVLPGLLEIARRIAQPLDVPWRLAENATRDSEPGVRLHNLRLLIHELPGHPATAWALRKACSDENPELRFRAAKELGAEARYVLLELAEGLEVDAVSADALSLLDPELPFERLKALLGQAVDRRRLRTACLCLEAIGRSGAAEAVGIVAKVLEQEAGELAPAAARVLGAAGSPAAEPHLIQALERDQDELRVAAATALGRVGSAAAVLPLKEAAERSRFDLELRRATRQAIAEIQSRVQGASPGQLSLARAEGGELSLATDPDGQLSLGDGDEPA